MGDQCKCQTKKLGNFGNYKKTAYRLVTIFGLLITSFLLMACGLIPAVAAGNVDSNLLHWDELPKEFAPFKQSDGIDLDNHLAYEATFRNKLPHEGKDLVVINKVVIDDPQMWRVYLSKALPGKYEEIDAAYGKESIGFLSRADGQKYVEILFLKGNAFVSVHVQGDDSGKAIELARSTAEKLAIRLPDSIANPTMPTYTELKVDDAANKRVIQEIVFGTKPDGNDIDPNLNLTGSDHDLCYRITTVSAPIKFTTAVVNTQSKTYIRKTIHYDTTNKYSDCESFHMLPGEYAFAIWYDDALVYYQPFIVNKP